MKRKFDKRKVAALMAFSSLALLTGCGQTQSTPGVGGVPGSLGGYMGGCVPLMNAGNIAFNAVGATFTSNYLLKAGALPVDQFSFQYQPETVGTVQIGNTGVIPNPLDPNGGMNLQGRSPYNGTMINVTLSSTMVPTQPYNPYYPPQISGPVTAKGTIQLSSVLTSYLAMMAGNNYYNMSGFPYPAQLPGYMPYQTMPPSTYPYPTGWNPGSYPQTMGNQNCISGVAFRLERLAGTNLLGLGAVWLYMNGQPRGVSVPF